MSITQARTLIVKHHKYAWILTLAAVFVISGVYFRDTVTHAATYYLQQSSWSGGVSASTATHSSNQNSGWNTYDSASSTLTIGNNIMLSPIASSFTDDGTLTTTGTASGGGFRNGTVVNTLAADTTTSDGHVVLGRDSSSALASYSLDTTNLVGQYTSVRAISTSTVFVSYYSLTGSDLKFAKTINGGVTWTTSTIDSTGAVGLGTSIYAPDSNTVYISYYDNTNTNLKFAKSTDGGSNWSLATIDSSGSVGTFNSMDGDGNGTLYISYVDATNVSDRFVKYAKSVDAGANWTFGTIDNPTPDLYGAKISIDVLSSTTAFVTYVESNGFVKFAKTVDGGTNWTLKEILSISGSVGGSSVVATDVNTILMVFDNGSNSTSDLKFAKSVDGGTNWTVSNIDTVTNSGGALPKAIYAADALTLFVAYPDNSNSDLEFAKSTNGGSTWTLQTIESATAAGKDLDMHGFGLGALFITHYESTGVDLKFATYPFATTGTFTSAPINLGGPSVFNVVSWNATLNGQTITMKVRSDSNSNMSGATAWASCSNVTSGGNASDGGCVTDGHQYVQYQATLNGTSSVTPVLNDVTVNHSEYAPLGSLVSSAYNSESDANIMGGLVWTEDATLPSGSTATFYLRTSASSDFSGSTWSTGITSGTTGCSKVGTTVTCTTEAVDAALRDGLNDQWFQYKVTLTSSGASTPTVDNVQVAYVVNGPPTFDTSYSATGVITSQNTTIGDADYGKVNISYRVGDIDTASFTPSFKYSVNGGSSWSDIPSNDLSASATSLKTYTGGATTTFSVVWNATSTLSASPVNIANAKIRVTANDGDVANNIGTADSAEFTLDTIAPEITSGNFVVDSSVDGAGSAGTPGDNRAGIKLYATDYSTIQYRLCNNSAFPATDSQGNSCAWSSLAASPISLATSSTQWITTGYPSAETVYVQVRDAYGNVTSGTASAPAMPANFDYKDVSNTAIGVYREFLSWSVFSATESSTFTGNSSGRYKLYHATAASGDPAPASSAYSAVTSISDPSTNYTTHNITSATTSVHYYKVTAVNDQGSISDFTAVLSDIPNGSGGAVALPPVITNTPAADAPVKNTSAHITFTTDSLATSTIEYGTTNSYGSTAYQTSFVENHSVYLNSLSPNTAYYFRAKATNAEGLDSDWAVGTTFTTAQGTVISGVTPMNVTDKTATIFWNTNASSTSKVYYGTSRSGSTLVGSVTVTGTSATTAGTNGKFQHQVGVPSSGAFTAGNTYYYKVESTGSDGNTTTDDNNGQFYSFTTTLDTTAPTISSISAAVVGPTSAVIVWTTDEPATSQVRWSGSAGNHSKRTTTDMTFAGIPSYSVYHVATLSSQTQNIGEGGGTNLLVAETPYYYTVVSADAASNETESAEQTLTTTRTGEDVIVTVSRSAPQGEGEGGPVADTTSPVVTNMKVSDITPFTATVTFDTSEGSVGKLAYSKDTSYGDHAADDFSWGTKHSIKLRGLTLGTQYHIKAAVVDKAGNTGYSEEQTFKTSFLSENVKELSKIENIEQFQKEIEDTIESILPSLVPPFVSKPSITDITESGATISFRTNIKAFPLIGFVEDGTYNASKENPYTSEVSDTTEKATNHTLALLNLKPNTKYHVQARAFSLPQVVGKSEDLTFTTQASKIQSSIVETKRDSFTVVWITDEPTTSIVEYKDLSSGITQRKADDRKTTSHSVKIENLPSGTSFDVNVSGLNEGGNLIEGGSTLHVTTSRDIVPPTISNFKVSNAMVPGRTDRIQTIISWTTNEPADSVVFYEEGIGTAGAEEKELANKSEVLDAYVLDHNIIISSLKPGAIYRVKVTSVDESGNLGVFGPRTIITPKQTESITDIIFKNFEDSFKFLRDM